MQSWLVRTRSARLLVVRAESRAEAAQHGKVLRLAHDVEVLIAGVYAEVTA